MNETGWMTVQEVARIFRVNETTVRRWATLGTIEVEWISRSGKRKSFFVKKSSVEYWLRVRNGKRDDEQ